MEGTRVILSGVARIPFPLRTSIARIAVSSLVLTLPLTAAEPTSAAEQDAPEFPRHHFTVFAGGTTNFDDGESDGETSATVGLEYEFRFCRWMGGGVLFEDVFGGQREFLIIVPFSLHPWRGLRLTAGPGADFRSEDTEFVFRAGIGYEFELGKGWTLAPEVAGDFANSANSLVFGVSLGWGF